MAIIKLVCQGCGANLDALDSSRIIECGYCGTQNQIRSTVHHEPPPAPFPPVPPSVPVPPMVHYQAAPVLRPKPQPAKGAPVALAMAMMFAVMGGGVAVFLATAGGGSPSRGQNGGLVLASEDGQERQYRWESGRPFVADLDGDGSEDLLGLIQVIGTPDISIIALSGSDWKVLWEVDLGDRSTMPEQPHLRFDYAQGRVVFAMGAAVRAYDPRKGESLWVANLPDKTEAIVRDEDRMWVRTIDGSTQTIAFADGQVTPAQGEPSDLAKPMRTDEGYDLIPSNRLLDLEYEQFDDLRIETAFCPPELLDAKLEPVRGFAPVACTWEHGLAWASRNKGTAVPFLVGYEPRTKQERWRKQLTSPGSLETIDSGFNQPRAEFLDGDAVISFSPSTANGTVTIQRINMIRGDVMWQAKIERKSTENVDGMVLGKDRVYVNHGGCMVVLDLASGSIIERLGGW